MRELVGKVFVNQLFMSPGLNGGFFALVTFTRMPPGVCVCTCVCVRVCVRARARACVCVCVRAMLGTCVHPGLERPVVC